MEHADRFLRRFYIEKGMFGSLSLTFIFYRPPLIVDLASASGPWLCFTPTSNGWIRGAILTVDGIIFNCRDHEYGRYRGLESHKGAVFLVFLFSVSWLRFIVARSSPHAHANTKENLFT